MNYNYIKSILESGFSITRTSWDDDQYVFMDAKSSELFIRNNTRKTTKRFIPSISDLTVNDWTIKR